MSGSNGVTEERGDEYTTERYPEPDWDRLAPLQELANAGLIKLQTVWCSELGIVPATGHFHGPDATHVPDTFSIVVDPPLAERLKRRPEPMTFSLPIRPEVSS